MQNTNNENKTSHYYIHSFLLHTGAVRWSRSSQRLELALRYIIDNKIIPAYPMKCLYTDMAKQQKIKYGVIERSLRHAIESMWKHDAVLCSKLFYRSSVPMKRPCLSEFFAFFLTHIVQGK